MPPILPCSLLLHRPIAARSLKRHPVPWTCRVEWRDERAPSGIGGKGEPYFDWTPQPFGDESGGSGLRRLVAATVAHPELPGKAPRDETPAFTSVEDLYHSSILFSKECGLVFLSRSGGVRTEERYAARMWQIIVSNAPVSTIRQAPPWRAHATVSQPPSGARRGAAGAGMAEWLQPGKANGRKP